MSGFGLSVTIKKLFIKRIDNSIFSKLDDIVESIEQKKLTVETFLSELNDTLKGLTDVLTQVGDIVEEINGFLTIVSDLIYSDIFDGVEFDNFIDLFAGGYGTKKN